MSSSRFVVAIASRRPIADTSEERIALAPLGAEVIVIETTDRATLLAGLRDVDVVVNRFGRFDAETIGQLDR
ncbi:MAG TPA: hypothetical protein VKX96_15465, partial [Chloroflexota bacterium]|nr:hypothetical protein [Chloroflexota bacterium]